MPRKRNSSVRSRTLTDEQQAIAALTAGLLGDRIPEADWRRLRATCWRHELEAATRPSHFIVPHIARLMDADPIAVLRADDPELAERCRALLDLREAAHRDRPGSEYLPVVWTGNVPSLGTLT